MIENTRPKRGAHPNSLKNLKPGSARKYEERKKAYQITLTPTAIANLQALALELDCRSTSDLIERLARGEFELGMGSPVSD